ncbi:peptidase M4 [Corallococcus sp. H22C18031201]|nr:peptidase M4 [Corallococcus sp. H22C18031201]
MRNRLLAVCLTLVQFACEGTQPPLPTSAPVARDSGEDIQAALRALPSAESAGAGEEGVPFLVRGDLGRVEVSGQALSARDAEARASAVLESIAPVFRLRSSELVLRRSSQDARGDTHLRYGQRHEGLEVIGQELILHVDGSGRVFAANGTARGDAAAPVPSDARLSPAEAGVVALGATPGGSRVEGTPRLAYVRASADARLSLVFEAVVTGVFAALPVRDHVYVNALDGAVVSRTSDIHEVKNRRIYSANGGYALPGALKRAEGGVASTDAAVNAAYDNLGRFYDCYQSLFGRDSFNGTGGALLASVHYGSTYVNAYWDGTQMVCGDSPTTGPLCNDMDIVMHEFTHAVTQSESNLSYTGEPGGLNESLSDMGAAYCESWVLGGSTAPEVWRIAEDTFGASAYSLADPARNGGSVDFYGDFDASADPHLGAGIPGLAFSLLAQGGTHPRGLTCNPVASIGLTRAAVIFYMANTNYFTPTTTFAQAKVLTETVADTYYGPTVKASVTQAWLAVGVGTGLGVACPPVALANGVGVRQLYGALGSSTAVYAITLPAGASNLVVSASGGTGDADLYLRFGAAPTSTLYDCRPYLTGTAESCVYATPAVGTYYVILRGRDAFAGVTLRASFTRPDGSTVLWVPDLAGATGSLQTWSYSAVAGQSVTFSLSPGPSGATGDADLYVRFGGPASPTLYDCRSSNKDNLEQCGPLTHATAGTYSVLVHGYSAFTGVDALVQ